MATKDTIRIREKTLKDGTRSLYLDIYTGGKRKYEFLKIYLSPGTTKQDRDDNRRKLQLAEAVRAKRVLEVQSGTYGIDTAGASEVYFYTYFRQLAAGDRSWESALKHIRGYCANDNLLMSDITKQWAQGLADHLRACPGGIKPNTAWLYYSKFSACIHRAITDGLISRNPLLGISKPRLRETEREYLTTDELARLWDAPCRDERLKRMFLFSCLTGLRYSDVSQLTWADVSVQGGRTRIRFRQQKTKGQEYLDINPQAAALMGEPVGKHGAVFGRLCTHSMHSKRAREWFGAAGIERHITFHSARHTFAVMMLDLGTDIYTVSKLLGHRELSTTQVYAKVLDKNKQAAVERIPTFGSKPKDKD